MDQLRQNLTRSKFSLTSAILKKYLDNEVIHVTRLFSSTSSIVSAQSLLPSGAIFHGTPENTSRGGGLRTSDNRSLVSVSTSFGEQLGYTQSHVAGIGHLQNNFLSSSAGRVCYSGFPRHTCMVHKHDHQHSNHVRSLSSQPHLSPTQPLSPIVIVDEDSQPSSLASSASSPSAGSGSVKERSQVSKRSETQYSALHEEMRKWSRLMLTRNKAEKHIVHRVLDRVMRVSQRALQDKAQVHLFGSRASNLGLPGSDLDILVTTKNYPMHTDHARLPKMKRLLVKVAEGLNRCSLVKKDSIIIIPNARVPIIKFMAVEESVQFHCDISFARPDEDSGQHLTVIAGKVKTHGGVEASQWALEQKEEFPKALPALLLVMKAVLNQKGLGEPAHGGLGGYSLLNMITTFLRQHGHSTTSQEPDLGDLLSGFLLKFAEFPYDSVCISLNDNDMGELPQEEAAWTVESSHGGKVKGKFGPRLHIQDPVRDGNDIGSPTWNLSAIQDCFRETHQTLNSDDTNGKHKHFPLLSSIMILGPAGFPKKRKVRQPGNFSKTKVKNSRGVKESKLIRKSR